MENLNSAQKTDKLIEEVFGENDPIVAKEEIKEEKTKNESMLFDFSSTFKQTTKAGKAAKKKKKALADAAAKRASKGDDENAVPVDETDNIN